VVLSVLVSAQGTVIRVDVKQSSGFDLLDDAALRAVRQWQFDPARVGSRAVKCETEVPVQFKLVREH
jgi:protein TonB